MRYVIEFNRPDPKHSERFGHFYQRHSAEIHVYRRGGVDVLDLVKEGVMLCGALSGSMSLEGVANMDEHPEWRQVNYTAATASAGEVWVIRRREGGFLLRGPEGEATLKVTASENRWRDNHWTCEVTGDDALIRRTIYDTICQHPAGYGTACLNFRSDGILHVSQSDSCD